MNAMILAAGRGTRLGELSKATPKALIDLAGEPLLARQVRYLKDGGIERIVINAHHLADQIERFAATHDAAKDIEVVVEEDLLGTAGGVCNALALLGGDDFLVLYGDVLIEEPIDAVCDTHRRLGGECTITVYRSGELLGKGTVTIDGDGTVVAFEEKASSSRRGWAYVNAGMYVLRPGFLSACEPGVHLDFGHDVFPRALRAGERIVAHELAEPVIDMGTPAALERARERAQPRGSAGCRADAASANSSASAA